MNDCCIDRIVNPIRAVRASLKGNEVDVAPLLEAKSPNLVDSCKANGIPTFKEFKMISELALVVTKKWAPGTILNVFFMQGSTRLQQKVLQTAQTWSNFANIQFAQTANVANAHIRVAFIQGAGSWSYIGTDALTIPVGEPTMNFGWLDDTYLEDDPQKNAELPRVVLHEFGHALGCIHEHQNPAGNIQWNTPVVYADYGGYPNFWSQAQVNSNLFAKYNANITQFTALDPHSIMMYPIPARHTLNGFTVGWNSALSATDQNYIHACYP